MLVLLVIILLVHLLEFLQHALQKSMSSSTFWVKFHAALTAEFSTLGLLSFLLFIGSQSLSSASEHDDMHSIVELTEFMHVVLFVTVIT
jgi:hypothetical protein